MATTTNYGWTTPDDSALVKDGASAIRTLGSSIDTSVKSLSPGTTAGDIDYYTSSTAKARVGIGSTGQVLAVSGGVPAWTTLTSGTLTVASVATGNVNSGTSVVISSLTQDFLELHIKGVTWVASGTNQLQLLINGSTSAVYETGGWWQAAATNAIDTTAGTSIQLGGNQSTSAVNHYVVRLTNCKSTGFTNYCVSSVNVNQSSGATSGFISQGVFKTAAQVTSLTINVSAGNTFNGTGTYSLFGG